MGIEGYYEDYFDERKNEPETNYDRIRNMSVDEMVELLTTDVCVHCSYRAIDCDNKNCTDGIKQWLLAEVEE